MEVQHAQGQPLRDIREVKLYLPDEPPMIIPGKRVAFLGANGVALVIYRDDMDREIRLVGIPYRAILEQPSGLVAAG